MIFLTGATGFLGRHLLGRLLLYGTNEEIALLVRPGRRNGTDLEVRVKSLLREIFSDRPDKEEIIRAAFSRIKIIPGDLSLENFGLGESEFSELSRSTTRIFHSAASTSLGAALKEARHINVGGTEQILHFANLGADHKLKWFNYISTAYVAGDYRGTVHPHDLRLSVRFRNGYEQSKAEAEALVRGLLKKVPFTIYRPSIIVGDSETGETSAFNVLYAPARLLAKGLVKAVPAIPHTPFDVVPVNYVADAIFALSRNEYINGECYHLCCGVGRESSPLEVRELLFKTVNSHNLENRKRLHTPPFVSPDIVLKYFSPLSALSAAKERMRHLEQVISRNITVLRQIIPFLPYLVGNPQFETSTTNNKLNHIMPPAPLFRHYAEVVFRYCLDTNWGKLPWHNPAALVGWATRLHPHFL